MADFDYNVYIKAHALQAIKEVRAFDSALERMQGTVKKVDVSTRTVNKWVKQFEAVANPIEFAVQQMGRLNKELAKAKTVARVTSIQKQQAGLIQATGMSQNFQNAYKQATAVRKAQEALEAFERKLDPTMQKLYELGQKLNDNRKKFIELASAGENTAGVERSIKKIKGQMQKLEESTKKTSNKLAVLWGRIKNIAIYRAIRTLLRTIASGFQEGLNNFVQYSDSANKTVSKLNASLKQIRNTMGIALAQTLTALEPIITRLADLFVDLLNSFNLAMAKMQGKNVYSKAKKNVEDYAKSLQKVQKLSFDSFETLSGGDGKANPAEMFEDANVDADSNSLSKAFEKVLKILKEIWDYVKGIIDIVVKSGIIDSILNLIQPILEIANIISKILSPIIESVMGLISGIVEQVAGAFKIVSGLLKVLTGDFSDAWENIKEGILRFFNGMLNMFIGLLNIVVDAINLIIKPVNLIGRIFGAGEGFFQIPHIPNAHIGGYENGGIPDKSELFYMNENGIPEALVNTGGNQTNVINIDQLSEGMRRGFVQAIYDTGLLTAMQQGSSTIMVDKDVLGRTVAESAGFRNEVNRRNVSLNLR